MALTRVHGRTVTAGFATLDAAREAAQRIRERDLGETQVDSLVRGSWDGGAPAPLGGLFGPEAPGLLPMGDLGSMSALDARLVQDALDHPGALVGRRPRLGGVLLTVVAREEDVPAVVTLIKESGGSV